MTASFRVPVLLALALAVAGCSTAPYIYQTYLGTPGRVTRIDCQEAYDVFDKAASRRLLVRSSPGVEIARAVCGSDPAAVRFRKAAQQFLVDTDRQNCTVSDVGELTPFHVEFTYQCPTPTPITLTPPRAR